MTTPPPSGGSVGRATQSPRLLAAWALLGYIALVLFFEFFDWILPDGGTFSGRTILSNFVTIETIAMPVLAVLLAAHVAPVLPMARTMALVALIEYAIILFFGLMTLLIGLGSVFDGVEEANDAFDALGYLVLGLARLGLAAIAALVVQRTFASMPSGHGTTPRT